MPMLPNMWPTGHLNLTQSRPTQVLQGEGRWNQNWKFVTDLYHRAWKFFEIKNPSCKVCKDANDFFLLNWHFQVFEPTVGVAEWPSSQYMVWNFSKPAIHNFLVWLQPISLLHQIFFNITINSFLLQPIAQKTYGFDGDQEKLAQNLLNIKVIRC